jgi:hypothetical protein
MAQPCRFLALGICKKGEKCTYSHDSSPPASSRPNGNTQSTTNAAPARAPNNQAATASEANLKRWRWMIPRKKQTSRPLGNTELSRFLQLALELVTSDESAQDVITTLASEEGLLRVQEIICRKFDLMSDSLLKSTWNSLLLPYFRLISHENVLRSTILQVRHATLLNVLYGIDGASGAALFRAATQALTIHA